MERMCVSRIEICVNNGTSCVSIKGGGMVIVQKGGQEGCGPHCQNLRPRYRSTHQHTLERERERGRGEREKKERERYKRKKGLMQKCKQKSGEKKKGMNLPSS